MEWFTSSAPVVFGSTMELDNADLLVVPEPLVFAGADPAPGCRKVIYNQNHFTTFENTSWADYPAWSPRPPMWVSSRTGYDIAARLTSVIPIDGVMHIPLAVDTDLFRPSEERDVLGIVEKVVTLLPSDSLDHTRLAFRAWGERMYPQRAQVEALTGAAGAALGAPASGGKARHPWAQTAAGQSI